MSRRHRVALAILAVAASAACGSASSPTTPTTPVPVPPAINPLTQSGTWTMYLTIDSCVSSRSECPSSATGALIEMTLRAGTVGQSLAGVLQSHTVWITDLPVAITGQLQPDGAVRYTGSYQSESPIFVFRALDVQELMVRPDTNAGLSGTLRVVVTTQSEVRTVKATVRSASRQPFADTPRIFQGAFEGFGTLRSCEGTCPNRSIGSRLTIALWLNQTGNVVDGVYGTINVSGPVNGSDVSLTGEWLGALDASGLGTTLSRLESFAGSLDALGRLTGTLRVYSEGIYNSGRGAITIRSPFTERLTIELTTVLRQ